MNSRDLYKALNAVEDRYLNLVDAPQKEIVEMKPNYTRKALSFLTAAAICVSILTVTAMAAGWIPGIFRSLAQQELQDQDLFEAAAQVNTEALPEVKELPHQSLSTFTLLERYYNGETILLGYDMDLMTAEPVIGYAPDEELLENLQLCDFADVDDEFPQAWEDDPTPANSLSMGFPEGAARMDQMFCGTLSRENYDKVWNILRTKGYVCVVFQNLSVGDHILVNGTDVGSVLRQDVGNMRWNYEAGEGLCIKLNPLPESVRDLDQVTVTLEIHSGNVYYYLDLEGNAWYFYDGQQSEQVEFILDNTNRH